MGMMDRMMGFMMGRMSKEEKGEMMDRMMGNFFADMTAEDKRKIMEAMMPRMMEGINMMEMMPQCLNVMLPKMPQEKRIDFVLKMIATLMEQGSAGLSEEERKDFMAKVLEKVNS